MMKKNQKKGIALIFCVLILFFLSSMAIFFLKMTSYDRKSATNYNSQVEAHLLALSGVEHASSFIFNQLYQFGYIRDSVVIYPHEPGVSEYQLRNVIFQSDINDKLVSLQNGVLFLSTDNNVVTEPSLHTPKSDVPKIVFSGRIQTTNNQEKVYILKIINLAARFNVNSHKCELDGIQQQNSNIIVNKILGDLAIECGFDQGDSKKIANAIRPVDQSNNFNYVSIREVESTIRLELYRDKSEEELIQYIKKIKEPLQKYLDNLCVHSWINQKTARWLDNQIISPPSYIKEDRSPVDINYASKDLLKVIIQNIKATKIFSFNEVIFDSEENFTTLNGPPQTEFNLVNKQQTEILDFNQVNINGIIEELIFDDNGQRTFFTTQNQLDNVIENLSNFFPPPPSNLDVDIWLSSWKDALKSNFNPNIIDNYWNPNAPVARDITKGDLYLNNLPTHTTELCFSSNGRFEISSIGMVVEFISNKINVYGRSDIRTVKNFAEIVSHSTQREFANGSFTNTISYPDREGAEDSLSGWLEVSLQPTETFLGPKNLFEIDFTKNFEPENENINPRVKGLSIMEKSATLKNSLNNNLAKDGLFSRNNQYQSSNPPRYYGARTMNDLRFQSDGTFPPLKGPPFIESKTYVNAIKGRDIVADNAYDESRISNYKGAIEFWVKLDVDAIDPVECGLLSINQVGIERLSELSVLEKIKGFEDKLPIVKVPYKEGTQMVLIKNSRGELRLTRLYFCGFFDDTGKYYGTKHSKDGDINRKHGRRDVIVNIKNWLAHTWHHILIIWDDTDSDVGKSLKLVVDGKDSLAEYSIGQPGKGEYCILSERDHQSIKATVLNSFVLPDTTNGYDHQKSSMDGLFINGIFKRQIIKPDVPLKKHNATFRYSSDINSIGNATINNFVSYDTLNKEITLPIAVKDRFATNNVKYQNLLEINSDGVLGPMKWTVYPRRPQSNSITDGVPFIFCSANFQGAKYNDNNESDGYHGEGLPIKELVTVNEEGLPIKKLVTVKNGDKIDYSVDFFIPSHKEMLNGFFEGSISPALESLEVMILVNKFLEYEDKFN